METIFKEELDNKIDEGMMPELGGRYVMVKDINLHITEMPIFYVKKLNQLIKPIYSLLSGSNSFDAKTLLNAESIEKFYDTLLDVASLITERLNPEITRDFLENSVGEKTLLNIIQTQLEVNGLVNFLKDILAGVVSQLNVKTNI